MATPKRRAYSSLPPAHTEKTSRFSRQQQWDLEKVLICSPQCSYLLPGGRTESSCRGGAAGKHSGQPRQLLPSPSDFQQRLHRGREAAAARVGPAGDKGRTGTLLPLPTGWGEWEKEAKAGGSGEGRVNRAASEADSNKANSKADRAVLTAWCPVCSRAATPSPPRAPAWRHMASNMALFGQFGSPHPARSPPGCWGRLTLSWPNPGQPPEDVLCGMNLRRTDS